MNISDIGMFPCSGPEARKSGELFKVTESGSLKTVFGREYPVKINFYVSNDVVHVGEWIIPSGGIGSRVSEVNTSKGDTCFFVKDGPITFFLPESREVFHVQEGETLFLPENTPYQIINYSNRVLKAVFAVAPVL